MPQSTPLPSPRSLWTRAWLVLLLSVVSLTFTPAPLLAQEDEEESENPTEQPEEPAAADEEDEGDEEEETLTSKEQGESEDYEELKAINAMEAEVMQPTLLDSASWNPELLAPYRGALADFRNEAGLIHELHGLPQMAPRGAALCEHPAVRSRFEATQVLGRVVRLDEPELRAYLDFFDGRGKPILTRWLQRMGRYEPMIKEVLREEGLPEDLIYVAMIESGFSPRAKSPASAVGVWQFIETTGVEMGLRIDRHVDERRDPIKATRAAAKYLKRLHDRYESWPLALASYNGGPGLVDREVGRYNSNDYWFIARQRGMYDETRRYVPKVLAAALISKNRDIFGLSNLIPNHAWSFDLVEVENPTRLSVIADAIGSDVEALWDLNPELRAAATPPVEKGERYMLRIPEGKAMAFVKRFDGVPASGPDFVVHEVAYGENVALVSAHYGVKTRVLRAVNGLGKRDRLRAGEQVVVPRVREAAEESKSGEGEIVLVPQAVFDYGESKKRYVYVANQGDRIDEIARAFSLNPSDIAIWNAVDPRAKLKRGMHLQLFLDADHRITSLALQEASHFRVVAYGSPEYEKMAAAKQAAARKRSGGRSGGGRYHKVRAGESLWTVARKYKTTVTKLKRLNPKLKRSNTLQPGDKLRVR